MNPAIQFDLDLFVDRENEQKLFLKTVHATTERKYLEFNGIAGQGKTELLKWIFYEAKKEGCLSAHVDFERAEYHRSEIFPILETIADYLSEKEQSSDLFKTFKHALKPYLNELRKYYREAWLNQNADQKPLRRLEQRVILSFKNDLNDILKFHKVVICLDSTEKAYDRAFYDFEEQILAFYTENKSFMLVTAGQEQLTWHTTELKRKSGTIKRQNLPRLDPESVHDQLNCLARNKGFKVEDVEQIRDKMFKITLGHPFSNYKLIDFWMEDLEPEQSLNHEIVEQQFNESIQILVKKFIEERVLENLQLREDYPSATEILWYLSPLRYIEFGILWFVLSSFLPKWFDGRSFAFFEHLLKDFSDTHVFKPWRLGSGYELEPVVLNVLLLDMRRNEREIYIQVQKVLAEQYNVYVEQTRDDTQIKYIVERLYHYAAFLAEDQPSLVNTEICNELSRYLNKYFNPESARTVIENQMLLNLKNQLQKENNADNGLKGMGVDISALLKKIDEFMREQG